MKMPSQVQVDRMKTDDYFYCAAERMKMNAPPHLTDWSTIAHLKRWCHGRRGFNIVALDSALRSFMIPREEK